MRVLRKILNLIVCLVIVTETPSLLDIGVFLCIWPSYFVVFDSFGFLAFLFGLLPYGDSFISFLVSLCKVKSFEKIEQKEGQPTETPTNNVNDCWEVEEIS